MATTTPNYGWDVPTSTDYVKDGATAIETLGDDIDATLWTALGGAYPGLRLVKKQTIGSAVSSVTVTSAFSAAYDNYRIVVTGGVASASVTGLQLGLSGITTGYYVNYSFGLYSTSGVQNTAVSNNPNFPQVGNASTACLGMQAYVTAPFLAKPKSIHAPWMDMNPANAAGVTVGYCSSTASATGFTITINTGTMTGGTIYVYGEGIS